ncbi:MAG: hypothetical protein ACTHWW_07015 [Arthrobacter sp.]|uniref:hypothetical protein n=1 Tax=unclassified Arthrobacter TaxID=235627 RepID=UPI00264C888C|nr:hypothetical protein [Micrococcaceae bacterium]MDN5814173.1 hypothetical protein [Micrococcaceae bacterium]MDN5825471.1 hypothetical protein [Micrococcaceae bacterium]MDN5879909.1 hypothetical protein [Micrococcaceae bacterium]MDN5886766.1 hypothetical protein [Micrococcaceae bacterium]
MPTLLRHHSHAPAAPPAHAAPRFSGDWVDAVVVLGNGTVRIDTRDRGYLLLSDDFTSLREALSPPREAITDGQRTGVQFNEQLKVLLVPGGHERAGRSFFHLHAAPSAAQP